jgi:hypothetical protein
VSNAEPTINDLNPVIKAGVEREPIALIDTSGSMDWPAAHGSHVKRRDLVGEAMGLLVAHLEGQDSQAADEQAQGGTELGGLLTYGFASDVTDLGDLNSANWKHKWGDVQWGGGTAIMPAWEAAQESYMEEFGEVATIDRPALLTLVITDGEATDAEAFGKVLAAAKSTRYFVVAIVGFGPDHDNTLGAYKICEATNPDHVRVVTFDSETDPSVIADALISLVG